MPMLSKTQCDEIRTILINLEQEISSVLQHTEEDASTVDLDQSRLGRLSRMDALQQQAMARAENHQFALRLTLISKALKKLDSEDFGWCEDCDETIPHKRLIIKPESQYCISCQSLREKL